MDHLQFLITAGPTREPIDPVRYLSNRSSGRMGYALAEAAAQVGHDVVLVSGPVALAPPSDPRIRVVPVETAREMYEAVAARIGGADVAIMAAAVADFRPIHVSGKKVKKSGKDTWTLELERTEDILGSSRSEFGFVGFLVGFAAETDSLEIHAREKLVRKGCDVIVANDVSRRDIGFDTEDNEVVLFHADGTCGALPKGPKADLARELVRIIEGRVRRAVGASLT